MNDPTTSTEWDGLTREQKNAAMDSIEDELEVPTIPSGKVLFESLTPEDQTRVIQEVNEEIRQMNILYSQELRILRHTLLTLKPIVKAEHKGRIKCLVCQVENKKRDFQHLERCVWVQLKNAMRSMETR